MVLATNKEEQEQSDAMINLINANAQKEQIQKQLAECEDSKKELKKLVSGLGDDDLLDKKLDEYTLEELKNYLRKDENVESFFVTEDGTPLEITIKMESKKKEIEFKRDLLIHFKTTNEMIKNIDEATKKLDADTKEFNEEMQAICKNMSDNMLAMLDYNEEVASKMEDGVEKRKLEKDIRYIRSAYNMDIYTETIKKHPSVVKNTIKDMTIERRAAVVGKRYVEKLCRFKVPETLNLIMFLSLPENNPPRLSVEKQMLLDGQYRMEDLLVFSFIRWFSMADWEDQAVRKAHAAMEFVLKRIMNGEIDPMVKKDVLEHYVEYLKLFNE